MPKTATARRSALGENPLDTYFSPAAKKAAPVEAPKAAKKIRATFHIPADLFDEVRDAVYHLSGPPLRLTLAAFADHAFRLYLVDLKKTANKGKAFPKRGGELKGGRPLVVSV